MATSGDILAGMGLSRLTSIKSYTQQPGQGQYSTMADRPASAGGPVNITDSAAGKQLLAEFKAKQSQQTKSQVPDYSADFFNKMKSSSPMGSPQSMAQDVFRVDAVQQKNLQAEYEKLQRERNQQQSQQSRFNIEEQQSRQYPQSRSPTSEQPNFRTDFAAGKLNVPEVSDKKQDNVYLRNLKTIYEGVDEDVFKGFLPGGKDRTEYVKEGKTIESATNILKQKELNIQSKIGIKKEYSDISEVPQVSLIESKETEMRGFNSIIPIPGYSPNLVQSTLQLAGKDSKIVNMARSAGVDFTNVRSKQDIETELNDLKKFMRENPEVDVSPILNQAKFILTEVDPSLAETIEIGIGAGETKADLFVDTYLTDKSASGRIKGGFKDFGDTFTKMGEAYKEDPIRELESKLIKNPSTDEDINYNYRVLAEFEPKLKEGKVFYDAQTQAQFAKIASDVTEKATALQEAQVAPILGTKKAQIARGESQILSTTIAGEPVRDILKDPKKRSAVVSMFQQKVDSLPLDKYWEAFPSRDNPSDLELAAFLIDKNAEEKYSSEQRKILSNAEIQVDPTTGEERYSFKNQKEADLANEKLAALNEEYLQSRSALEEYNKAFEYTPEEESALSKYESNITAIGGNLDRFITSAKKMDYTYIRDLDIEEDIRSNKYGSKGEDRTVGEKIRDVTLFGIGGLSPRASTALGNIGRAIGKQTGGSLVRGAQFLGIEGSEALGSGFEYDQNKLDEISKQFGIQTTAQKGIAGGILVGSMALGGPVGGVTYALAGGLGEASDQLSYTIADKDKEKYMEDVETFEGALRAGKSAEEAEIASGWGGAAGGLRSALTDVLPVVKDIPFLGDRGEYKRGAREYYSNLGLSGKELDKAVEAASLSRTTGLWTESAYVVGSAGVTGEVIGRRGLSKSALDPLWRAKGATGATYRSIEGVRKLAPAGFVEGSSLSVASQSMDRQGIDYEKALGAGLFGAATAGAFGVGMTAFPNSPLSKLVERGGKAIDPTEILVDQVVDVMEMTSAGRALTGKIPVISFSLTSQAKDASGNKILKDVKLKTNQIKTVNVLSSGNTIIETTEGKKIIVPSTTTNLNTLSQVNINLQNEIQKAKGKGPMTQAQSEALAKIQAEATARKKSTKRSLAQSELFSGAQVSSQDQSQVEPEALAQSQAQAQAEAESRSQAQSQAQSEANVQAQVDDIVQDLTESLTDTQAQSQAQSSVLTPTPWAPFGMLPSSSGGGWGSGRGRTRSWLTNNKIVDYAAQWKSGLQSKQVFGAPVATAQYPQFQYGPRDDAQKAFDRSFGKNITSGNQFRDFFGGSKEEVNIPTRESGFNAANIMSMIGGRKQPNNAMGNMQPQMKMARSSDNMNMNNMNMNMNNMNINNRNANMSRELQGGNNVNINNMMKSNKGNVGNVGRLSTSTNVMKERTSVNPEKFFQSKGTKTSNQNNKSRRKK